MKASILWRHSSFPREVPDRDLGWMFTSQSTNPSSILLFRAVRLTSFQRPVQVNIKYFTWITYIYKKCGGKSLSLSLSLSLSHTHNIHLRIVLCWVYSTFVDCPVGLFGEECSRPCNCRDNTTCNTDNGACRFGCRYGFTGLSCSIGENRCKWHILNSQKTHFASAYCI